MREAVDREIDRLDTFFETYFEDDSFFTRAINIYDTLGEFEEKLTIALRSYIIGRVPSGPPSPNQAPRRSYDRQPYLGLASFDYADAPVFFGRTAQVGEIIAGFQAQELEALSNPEQPPRHFTLILGSSGSGKSSLARAGVLPMLTNPGVIEGATSWRTAMFKPADVPGDPILALVRSLDSPMGLPELFADGTKPREIADLIRSQPQGGGLLLRQALTQAGALALTQRRHKLEEKLEELVAGHREEDAKLLREKIEVLTPPAVRIALLADQMEELFTSDLSPETLNAFIAILVALANSGRVFVLATLRSDFYARCLEHPELIALMQGNGSYALPAPSAADIGQMIRQPATIAGLVFEEKASSGEKLDELLRDAALKDPTALPLLSYTLEQLYEQRTPEGMMTLGAYHSLGGLEGAIGSRAETVFTSLPGEAQAAFDPLCKQLVTLREGGEPTRRRAFYSTLTRSPEAKTLVDALVASRLLTADQSPDGERVIAVAHEALLRHWPRLVGWVEDNKLFLDTRSRLTSRLNDWLDHEKSDEYLIPRGPNLSAAESIATAHLASLDPVEIEFIGKSADKVRKADQRKLRSARLITVGAVVLCLLAVAGGILALGARNDAIAKEKQATVAEKRATTGEARTAYLLGVQLLDIGDTKDGLNALSQTLAIDPDHSGATDRLYSQHLYGLPKAIPMRSVAFDAGDTYARQRISGAAKGPRQLVTYLGNEKSVEVFDLNSRKVVPGKWEEEPDSFASLMSRDSAKLLNIRNDMTLRVWDVKTGKQSEPIQTHKEYRQLATSNDGELFFESMPDGEKDSVVKVYSLVDGSVVDTWKQKGKTSFFVESTGGTHTICVSDNEAVLFDHENSDHSDPVIPDEGDFFALTISAEDSPVFAISSMAKIDPAGNQKKVRLFSSETGELVPLGVTIRTDDWIMEMRLGSDASTLILAYEGGRIQPFAMPEGTLLDPILLPSTAAKIALSPDDRLLVTATLDGTVRIYDLDSRALAFDPISHDGPLEDLSVSWDGRFVLAATKTHARIWDLAAGLALTLPIPLENHVWCHGVARESNHLVVATSDGYSEYDLDTLKPVTDAVPHGPDPEFNIISENAAVIAERSPEGIAFYRSGEAAFKDAPVWKRPPGEGFISLSPDGELAAWTAEEKASIISTTDAKQIGEVVELPGKIVGTISFTPSGKQVALIVDRKDSIREGNSIALVSIGSNDVREISVRKIYLETTMISPDGRWLACTGRVLGQSNDYNTYVWDLNDPGKSPVVLPVQIFVYQTFFSDDSSLLAIRKGDQTIRVWSTDDWQAEGKGIHVDNSVPYFSCFSPDGTRIGIISHKGGKSLIAAWDWREGVIVTRTFHAPEQAYRLFYNKEGSKFSALWKDPNDKKTRRDLFGQWETTPPASVRPLLLPLTEYATASKVNARGKHTSCDPYERWSKVREIDPDSWFLKSPLSRSISPQSPVPALEWLNFPHTDFTTMAAAMPAVGMVHSSIAMWLQTSVNSKEEVLATLEEGSKEYENLENSIERTRRRIEKLVELGERNAYGDPEVFYGLAQQARRNGNFKLAEERLLKVLDIDPRHANSLRLIALIYDGQHRPEESVEYLERLHQIEPDNMQCLADLTIDLWNLGRTAEAKANFVALMGEESILKNDRGHIRVLAGDFNGALELFQEAAEEQKKQSYAKAYNLDSYVFLICGNHFTGNLAKAVELYKDLIATEPLASKAANIDSIYLGEEFRAALREVLTLTLDKHPELAPK